MTLRSLDQGKFDKPPEYLIRSMLAGIFGSIKVSSVEAALSPKQALTLCSAQSAFSIGKIGASSGDMYASMV